MSVDLSAIFGTAEPIVQGLIDSSGTTVRVDRYELGRGQGTTDPVTRVWTPDDPDAVVTASTGAILGDAGGSAPGPVGTATEVQPGDYLILLRADQVQVREQDVVTVLTCRDPRLLGRELDVLRVVDGSAGVARVLHARPHTSGPGAS